MSSFSSPAGHTSDTASVCSNHTPERQRQANGRSPTSMNASRGLQGCVSLILFEREKKKAGVWSVITGF